jgi:hypothetical protein
MTRVYITKEQIIRAKELYPFDSLNGSITKGDSNIYGALGEVVIYDWFKKDNPVMENTFEYDLIIKGYKVDVKTKRTTVPPLPNYLCSISAFNTHQKCDYYFFCRITEDLSKAYLLGYIKKDLFFLISNFRKKGEKDTDQFLFKDDCYNLEISELTPFKNSTKTALEPL